MEFKGFSKRDTSILKGIGILSIVFHNYFHWLLPTPGENEFSFASERVTRFFDLLVNEPGEFVNILFSFLGHYGVQVFLLVSGFGLTMSMLRREKAWLPFVWERLLKLYALLLTGLVLSYLGLVLMQNRVFNAWEWKEIGYKMLFIHTLLPNSGLSVNGPWWFFALIFQLYLLFPLLFRGMRRWGWKVFVAVCVVSYAMIFLFREVFNLYHGSILMQNAPGHLPEFCLGILLAFSKDKKIHWGWLVLAVAVFCLGNVYSWAYPFTFLAVAVMTVFAYQGLKSLPFKKRWIGEVLSYFGGISMLLFAVHGLFRVPFLNLAAAWPTPWGHLATGLLFFVTVWLFALAVKPLHTWLSNLFSRCAIRESKVTKILQPILQVFLLLFFAGVMVHYLVQDRSSRSITPTVAPLLMDQGVVTPADNYVTFVSFDLPANPSVVRFKGSFDFKSDAAEDQLPSLVADIRKTYWNSIKLTKRVDGDWSHYEFSCDFYRSFIQDVKDKRVSLYFLNRHQTEMAFRDVHVEVSY